MAQEQNISTQLNNLLVTRDYSPEMLDRQGKPASAEDAKTFTFDYVSGSGKNYGTMVVILDSDNDMKVFYGDNLGRAMEGNDKDEFFDFQQQLNKFARMHRWTYTATDLSQLKHTMQGLAAIQEGLFEGYYGTRRISYAGEPTEARLMIKHNRALGEADARFRYVESLYIETAESERFKLPFKNLSGGRAMLEHVRQGGNPYDVRGVHIAEMVQEIGTLSRFNRASATRVLEGATQQLITEAQAYYKSLRENMKRLASPRGYQAYFETWHPATIDEQQGLVEDIKTLFIEQTLDTRIEAALPLLARIQQQGNAMKEAQIFENWVNSICEGTWSLPETPEQQNKLRELLSQKLIVGPDATNATEQLYDLIGDDQLFDQLGEIAQDNPNADVAWAVIDRLKELGYDLGIEGSDADQEVDEGHLHNPGQEDSPVAQAITRRILMQRTDLLAKYGPGYVGQAIDDVAHSVGNWDEIGSSDVSGWVKQVEWNLKNKLNQYDEPINVGDALDEQGVAEGSLNENADVLAGLTDILKIAATRQAPQNPRYFAQQVKDVALQLKDNPATQQWGSYLDGVVRWADVIANGKEQYSSGFANEVHNVLGPATRAYQDALLNKQGVAEGELQQMLKHAGVVAEGRILDESGETLDHILDRFKFEVRQFQDGGDLDSDLYEALFDYYNNAGEMPYGVAKARTGDPYEWVTQRLDQDLGLNEGDNIATFEDDTADAIAAFLNRGGAIQQGKYHRPRKSEKTDYGSKHIGTLGGAGKPGKMSGTAANVGGVGKPVVTAEESTCNHTMEGEYCPEHGLLECGGMMEMGTVAGSMAPVVGEAHDDPMNYNAAITGSYYESKEDPLARLKSLALRK